MDVAFLCYRSAHNTVVHYKFENCTVLPVVFEGLLFSNKQGVWYHSGFAKMSCLDLGFPNSHVKLFCLRLFVHPVYSQCQMP